MRKFIKRSTTIVVSMFFLISLTDTPKDFIFNKKNVISADAAMNIEHQADIDNIKDINSDDKGTTEELFGEIDNIEPIPTQAQQMLYTSDTVNYDEPKSEYESDSTSVLLSIQNPLEELIILQEGVEDPVVAELQERLMELGFMEYAEPTQYFGGITKRAVMLFQRQNELEQDGIVSPEVYEMIMSQEAKFYLVKKGMQGDDVLRIQTRLYETGYLTSKEYLTGYFGDITEGAVKKMQEVNGITADGIIGQHTIELLYSEDIKSNYISMGEKSDAVLKYQNRLKELGYLTTTPDGMFGGDTVAAVKQFQSRNDLIVDGYLGPTTCQILDSSDALPNGLSLGDRGDNVKRVQELLSKYGYIAASNTTGYYGEITERAVKSFQSANGLKADGMVGTQTMSVLTGGNVKAASNTTSSSNSAGSTSSSKEEKSPSAAISSPDEGSVSELINVAMTKIGCRYVYGSKGPDSFDCSGFVYWCLNQVGVKQSYISSAGWQNVKKYVKISNFSDIRAGDIIVVRGHVGIATYNGMVIDASSTSGKIVHRELGDWWKKRFIVAWRIF